MKSAVMVFCPEISWGPVQPLIILLERVGDSGKVFADFYQKRWVYMGVCGGVPDLFLRVRGSGANY